MATLEQVFQAVANFNFGAFKRLIESNKSLLEHIDDEGDNLLMIFLKNSNFHPLDGDMFEYLVKSGIDLNHFNKDGNNALKLLTLKEVLYRSHNGRNYPRILMENGADAFLKNDTTGKSFFDRGGMQLSFFDQVVNSGNHPSLTKEIHEYALEKQKQYYEELIEQRLQEQKEQLLEELYMPDGIGYTVAKERFEKN